MPHLICWLMHRRFWTIVIPGVLPGHLDAVAFCPRCDRGRGLPERPRLAAGLPAAA